MGPGDRCSFGACPSPNKYLPRIGTVSSSGTESQRTVEFSNSSIIIAFFISRIALETGHTFLPEFKQQTKYVIVENEPTQKSFSAFDLNMSFTYVMLGWEGKWIYNLSGDNHWTGKWPLSSHRKYYLVDKRSTFIPGFLSPYRGERYHLRDYREEGGVPTTRAV